jgi:hypothetical protein
MLTGRLVLARQCKDHSNVERSKDFRLEWCTTAQNLVDRCPIHAGVSCERCLVPARSTCERSKRITSSTSKTRICLPLPQDLDHITHFQEREVAD